MSFETFSSGDRFYLGADLGQARDPTAPCIIAVGPGRRPLYRVGYLRRLPLHTLYTVAVWEIRQLLANPLFAGRIEAVIDLTGVGRPVADLFHDQGVYPTKVQITAGAEEVRDERDKKLWNVPKITLVSRVQTLLHDNRLHIHKDLAETAALVTELMEFRAHVTDAGRWTFGARSGMHDDLVLSLALACWQASKSSLGIWLTMGHSESEPRPPELEPGPGEVAVRLKSRIWAAGRNLMLEPGWTILTEDEAAGLKQYIS